MLLIPAIIFGSLVAGTAYTVTKRKNKTVGGMTPTRQKLFESLLQHQRDPKKLKQMASKFAGEGCDEQAEKLRRFAAICELPKEKKDERRMIFRKAMASKNRNAVLAVAQEYDNEGCIGSAAALRLYANGLPPQ